ncbi:SusC/RagA family TonB-linked outer membrane protein [Bacteroidia bacterium]|nr:SusC/RagA family TonB-linked outer membrane protein [Bacteroidia bacterium]
MLNLKVSFMKKVVLLLSCLLLSIGLTIAQDRTVSGSVVDGNGDPVIGASVLVKGNASIGTVTDGNGRFTLSVPSSAKTLVISYLGYTTAEVAVSNTPRVVLQEEEKMLSEVVVTALGISRQDKTLGYSATKVKGEDIQISRNTNVTNALQGKVAGLQIASTSSDPGTASSVTIRGFGSINGQNQPLYVVDGIPLQTNTPLQASGHSISTTGIANVAPDDIESLTVLKGASATALYGSRGANGVIIVTTKSGAAAGKSGKTWSIEYNGGLQTRQISLLPTFQNEFGQGWNGTQTFIENGSWGPRFDGSMQLYGPVWNNQQLLHKYEALPSNVKDFFESGITTNHNIALSGVSEDGKMDYYLSFSNANDDGIIPTDVDKYNRNVLAFRGGYEPAKWLKVSSSVNFARYKTDIVGSYQGPSVIDGLYETIRDVSLVDKKDLNNPFNTPEAYFTPYGITNPYWAIANNYNHTDGKQLYGKIQADIKPSFIPGLTLTYRYGFDYADYEMKMADPLIKLDDALIDNDFGYAPSSMNQDGNVYARYSRGYEINNDFMGNYVKNFDKISLNAIAGVNVNERALSYMYGQADKLSFNGFWDLSNGASWSSLTEDQWKRRMVGLFGDVTLGYDDMVYLELSARNDWSSTLPKERRNYFYPGATLSWIFTNVLPKNDILSFGKVRLAYGKTGRDADVYLTDPSFRSAFSDGYYGLNAVKFPTNSTSAYLASRTAGSSTLSPEMVTEYEAGLNLQFFKGRIGLDVAAYDRTTSDQIFRLPVDPATGYTTSVTNFGDVNNKGVEILLNFTPVQTKDFRWDFSVNFSVNKNEVKSMPDGLEGGKLEIYPFSAGNDAVNMYAEVGKPLGVYYTYLPEYVTDKSSPYYGSPVVDDAGQPVLADTLAYTGMNMHHKWTGGVTTSFTYKNLTLSAALDVRYGGSMFSRTKNLMQFTGNGIATIYNDRKPFIIPNSVQETGDGYAPNDVPLMLTDGSYQKYYDLYGYGNGGLSYMVDRTYAKIRNISLTYSLPKKWIKPLSGVELTAFVNNAFLWTAKDNYYIDPESSTVGSDLSGQFGELYVNPSCRVFGLNLKVNF